MDVDTIVSLSTAPGLGAVAVVRISGPRADDVLRALLPEGTGLPEERRVTLASLRDPTDGRLLDRALVTRFVGPASYTGDDLVEISCHGGWLTPELIVAACVRAGARQAEAGEFTRRAYLRGKIDLVQAESVADLINARSEALHRVALEQLERGLSARIGALRDRLLRVEALLAHHVDFPEEDDAPVPIAEVTAEATRLMGEMSALLRTAPEGELLREGALAVFAGRPNAGKSSLYNALVGRDRAIVTEVPGTTRDALESVVQLGGYPFRLVDTAGLRDSSERVEQRGIEVTHEYLSRADVVLFCVPADEALGDADVAFLAQARGVPVVLVRTKVDLLSEADPEVEPHTHPEMDPDADREADPEGPIPEGARVANSMRVSVKSGTGLGELRALLPSLVYSGLVSTASDVPVLTRRRHADALGRARGEVEAFVRGLEEGLPAEMASTHLRAAETALEEVIGVVGVDDVLDVVFREFCVGK